MLIKRIIFFVASIILIIGGLITYFVYNRISGTLIDLKQKEIAKLNVSQSRELDQIFNRSKQFAELIAVRTRVVEYLDDKTESRKQELIGIFDEYTPLYPEYLSIYLIDLTGNTLISTDRSFVGKNYGFRNYFKEAIKNKFYTEALLGTTSNQFGYYFSHAVINKKGTVTGVVVAKLNNQIINNILNEDQANRDSYLMLTDSQGIILYSQKSDRLLKSLGQLTNQEKKDILDKNKFGNKSIPPLQYDPVQEIIRHYSKPITINFFDKDDKDNEVIGIAKIKNNPYFLISEIETKDLVSFASEISIALSIAVLLAAILALIIVSIVISKFLQPFKLFKDFSQSISKGNYNFRLDIKSKDEFGQLAKSFNYMADSLKDSRENIEKKITERTQSLERLNKFMTGRELKMIELKNKIKNLEKKLKI